VNIYALNFIICSVGIATDLAILLLPVRVVLRLQMSTKRRGRLYHTWALPCTLRQFNLLCLSLSE
jgi:hypothetical protein